jgi:C4-type Zn-finger protein
VQKDITGGFDRNLLGRKVLVKVIQPETGKLIFKSNSIDIEPGGKTKYADLVKIEGTVASINSQLEIRIEDADDEEILDKANAILKIELDEW